MDNLALFTFRLIQSIPSQFRSTELDPFHCKLPFIYGKKVQKEVERLFTIYVIHVQDSLDGGLKL